MFLTFNDENCVYAQNVELRKAEKGKAWAPNVQKKGEEHEDDLEELKKKVDRQIDRQIDRYTQITSKG